MKKLTLTALLIFLFCGLAFTATIHIPADQPTIQQGINVAVSGDTVLVSPGVYPEHLDFLGKGLLVKSGQGAFLTTIAKASDGLPLVKFVSGESHQAVLEGFTVIGANSDYGGIEIRYSAPIIRYNIITHNRGNHPYDAAGGIYCWQSHALIVNNRIEYNISALYGAGIHLHYSDDTVLNNIIARNSGVQTSGIRSGLSKAIILNNVIAFNQNQPGYTAAGTWANDTVIFKNNIVYRNSPMGVGLSNAASDFDYNDVWGNRVEYHDTPWSVPPGPGCISADPLFVDETNFQLQAGSPGIDAGDPDPVYNDTDGSRNDMGIYGGKYPFESQTGFICGLVGDFDNDGQIKLNDLVRFALYIFRGNPQPELSCSADVNNDGKLSITDLVMLVRHIFRDIPLPRETCCEGLVQNSEETAKSPFWLSSFGPFNRSRAILPLLKP